MWFDSFVVTLSVAYSRDCSFTIHSSSAPAATTVGLYCIKGQEIACSRGSLLAPGLGHGPCCAVPRIPGPAKRDRTTNFGQPWNRSRTTDSPLRPDQLQPHSIMRPASTLATLVFGLLAGVGVAQTGNVTSLLGTWSSGSGAVVTGAASRPSSSRTRRDTTARNIGCDMIDPGAEGADAGEGMEVVGCWVSRERQAGSWQAEFRARLSSSEAHAAPVGNRLRLTSARTSLTLS